MIPTISAETARALAVACQFPDPPPQTSLAAVQQLGYVQIDTISVVERAHHHTLWNRCPDHRPEELHRLQAVDKTVFEYWGHAASILPMSDYRFYLPMMARFKQPTGKWMASRLESVRHLLKPVLERIRAEGPLGARDFAPPPGRKRGTWWDWKPAKTALEMLFWQGQLMIAERQGFQRIYDLTERVLPTGTDIRMPESSELGRFLVRCALQAYGVAMERDIREHIHSASRLVIAAAIEELTAAGELETVRITGLKGTYYALRGSLQAAENRTDGTHTVRILSPFDNLVIQRKRVKELFGFEYTLECYLPAAKRTYGYFVLPVLWNNRFAGRLDAAVDRKTGLLTVKRFFSEEGIDITDGFIPAFRDELTAFTSFNGGNRWTFSRAARNGLPRELTTP